MLVGDVFYETITRIEVPLGEEALRLGMPEQQA
jgi:hypothetical protein